MDGRDVLVHFHGFCLLLFERIKMYIFIPSYDAGAPLSIYSINGKVSNKQTVTQSIVQESGIGPVLYIVYASDLKAAGKDSILVKCAPVPVQTSNVE